MDDSCAVCAEPLEWVGYGACGHREVCSTCVARLRFICDDRRCCICKSDSHVVFVTKALGDYTRMVNDFNTLPTQVKEGKLGSYYYHEDTQAFFDDADHYKMIKAMCRLSCSVCDKLEQPPQDGFRRRQRFRNIGQLKGHLSHQHRLFMCDLCLEGRKVFICEQKLYTRAQLNQHRKTGDSEVDGTESERGGFSGHPVCDFCRTSFYGENELYSHMSTEHFTCHICQRRHPGQYEYYRDYDDLESHFRHDHFLCEDEACLAKKFIVFQTDADIKRHNAMEHGGRMSRSKRNAVLQIPTSFRYRSNNESGQHRGRRRSFFRESSPDSELNMAIQASLQQANAGGPSLPDPTPAMATAPLASDDADSGDVDLLVQPFESLNSGTSESSSRYRQAVSHSSPTAPLQGSSFPPLSAASSANQRSQQELDASTQNSMAARLRHHNNATVLNVARPTPATNHWPVPKTSNSRPVHVPKTSNSRPVPAPKTSTSQPVPVPSTSSVEIKQETATGSGSSSYAASLQAQQLAEAGIGVGGSWASRNSAVNSQLNHSHSAPNLVENRSFDPVSDFPPVSIAQPNRLQNRGHGHAIKIEDAQTANKSLVERIRAALDYDEDKYSAFKDISQKYRQGLIDTLEYIGYVRQFELTHLVIDLARLCPDIEKQRALIEMYNATTTNTTTQNNGTEATSWGNNNKHGKGSNSSSSSVKGKAKKVDGALADSMMSTVRRLQSEMNHGEGDAEVLGKDGYRSNKGKSSLGGDDVELQYEVSQDRGRGSKQKKKTSKFNRVRLGDASPAAILDVGNSTADPPHGTNPPTGQSARGVWGNGASHRLFTK